MSKIIIQKHHITYAGETSEDIIVPVTKGEHFILTRTQWLKELTPGFVKSMNYLLSIKPTRILKDECK